MTSKEWLQNEHNLTEVQFFGQLSGEQLKELVENKTGEIFETVKEAENFWNDFTDNYVKEFESTFNKKWDL